MDKDPLCTHTYQMNCGLVKRDCTCEEDSIVRFIYHREVTIPLACTVLNLPLNSWAVNESLVLNFAIRICLYSTSHEGADRSRRIDPYSVSP